MDGAWIARWLRRHPVARSALIGHCVALRHAGAAARVLWPQDLERALIDSRVAINAEGQLHTG
jgi:hypothetical protein